MKATLILYTAALLCAHPEKLDDGAASRLAQKNGEKRRESKGGS